MIHKINPYSYINHCINFNLRTYNYFILTQKERNSTILSSDLSLVSNLLT